MALSRQDLINKINTDLATTSTIRAVEHRGVLGEVVDYIDAKVVDSIANGVTLSAPTQNAVFDALALKENNIASGTTSQYWRGDKTFRTLDKAAVGLGNVDNTSDVNKPISTATQTALNGKEGTIAVGSTGQYWRGDKTFQTLNSAAVGLGNVDNTSDINKPVSTAQQAAIDAVRNSSAFIGEVRMVATNIDGNFNGNGVGIVAPFLGWALCDGRNGTVDMRGRVPVGRSNSDADFLATGQQGGAKTHELTQRQMPPHDHRPADGTNFAIWINNEAEGGSGSSGYEVSKDQKPTTTSVSGGYFENGVWKVEAHNNLQPYLVLVFIQRIS